MWVCHHGMVCTQVADEGDDLLIWRVATTILRSHGQPIRYGPPAWGLGKGLTAPHCKKNLL